MQLTSPDAATRPVTPLDAPLVHAVYRATPGYFEIISIPIPTLAEVEKELEAATADPRRRVELVLAPPGLELADWPLRDPADGRAVVGYLDYKLDYPNPGDATVNLLLVHLDAQGRGVGRHCVGDLERRLRGSFRRVLASIYGRNPRAERFWRSLGYSFAIDARPVLDWYAKEL